MRLIHITDPHLSSLEGQSFLGLRGKRRSGYLSWRKNRRHEHRFEVLEQLTDAVMSLSPDQVLVTGDLVHIGLESEMAEAAAWLRRLGTPDRVFLVPGNHDNYAADSASSMARHWSAYLPESFGSSPGGFAAYPVIRRRNGVELIGVNTACVTRIFSAAGAVGASQRERLAETLEASAGEDVFRCLLIHHPPFPGMTRRRKALRDDGPLRDLLLRCSPDLLLYGHLHRNREDREAGVRCFCTASASSVSDASFRVIDIERTGTGWHCRVQLMTRDPAQRSGSVFKRAGESSWSR